MRKINIIGANCDLTGRTAGASKAPEALRKVNLLKSLKKSNLLVSDHGDIKFPVRSHPNNSPPCEKTMVDVREKLILLSDACISSIDNDEIPLVIGGDHSISRGSITGALHSKKIMNKKLGVIWIDAHADLNTEKTSPSGNPHGMVAAALLGKKIPVLDISNTNFLDSKNLLGIGYTATDPGEDSCLKELKIPHIRAESILNNGLEKTKKLINKLYNQVDFLWISFDLDVICYKENPGVDTADGILPFTLVENIINLIPKEKLVGADVVELNPLKDIKNVSTNLAKDIVGLVIK